VLTPHVCGVDVSCLPAKTSQGPSIHPMLVGQHATSPGRTSWWKKALAAHLKGVTCVHGMALGSPATQEVGKESCRADSWVVPASEPKRRSRSMNPVLHYNQPVVPDEKRTSAVSAADAIWACNAPGGGALLRRKSSQLTSPGRSWTCKGCKLLESLDDKLASRLQIQRTSRR
jgi:hypothetical protein